MHISGLLADLMNQKPVTEADFASLAGKILLILPDKDFFSGEMQADLIRLMHDPQISYVSGGHLSTVLKAGDYVRTIARINRKNAPCGASGNVKRVDATASHPPFFAPTKARAPCALGVDRS